ncbi:ABC transporter permease [Rhizobium rhizogenes]|uniref:ABC transporter permease n=1 Tax=Rhizobium rhizogenes TaxID=359 RepID=UPI0015737A60|nr:ABC transporter permease [Rhizobium rhizogenes]NTH22899.1 ABC transporter permease [Rhizobium rhizogenes]NTH35928.1 ABC transporter permease [Rhizobium rhizogenes]
MNRVFAKAAWALFGACTTIFLIAPVLLIAVYSFSKSRYFRLPIRQFSLDWYVAFFASQTFRDAMFNTIVIAVIVTPLCLIAALVTAHVMARSQFAGKSVIDALILSPLIVPGVVTGVAFLSLFRILGIDIGLVRMSIAMVVVSFPYALRALAANYGSVGVALEEAARDLGAGRLQTYLRVTLPQLKPGLIAGTIFVAVEVIDNFAVNAFLVDLHSNTLPIAAYQHVRDFDDPLVAVMSTLLSLLSLIFVLIFNRLVGLEKIARS